MTWLKQNEFVARPLVVVEDHVYHISELLKAVKQKASAIESALTVVCLDKCGNDTDEALLEWSCAFPEVQLASQVFDRARLASISSRLFELSPEVFRDSNAYCRTLASFVRKSGCLLQDIELETLAFVPRDRWWESTVLASTIRGIVGNCGPKCAFFSNKRGYEATFGAELLAAGHDPRDVMNKLEMERQVVPMLVKYVQSHFPMRLQWIGRNADTLQDKCWVSKAEHDFEDITNSLDLTLWPTRDDTIRMSGLALAKSVVSFSATSNEPETWQDLIECKLAGSSGTKVQSVGERIAPTGALKAEVTNAAARHIHSLRKRLIDSSLIVTSQGHYRLSDELSVGLVSEV